MISQNRKIQEEEKKRTLKVNAFKKSSCTTKGESSFAKILEETSELHQDMKTSDKPSDPLLQFPISLTTNTIKEAFYNLGRNIGEFSDQKKRTVASDIVREWGQIILGNRACDFVKIEYSLTLGY